MVKVTEKGEGKKQPFPPPPRYKIAAFAMPGCLCVIQSVLIGWHANVAASRPAPCAAMSLKDANLVKKKKKAALVRNRWELSVDLEGESIIGQ